MKFEVEIVPESDPDAGSRTVTLVMDGVTRSPGWEEAQRLFAPLLPANHFFVRFRSFYPWVPIP